MKNRYLCEIAREIENAGYDFIIEHEDNDYELMYKLYEGIYAQADEIKSQWLLQSCYDIASSENNVREIWDSILGIKDNSHEADEINRLTRDVYNTHLVTCGNCSAIHNELSDTTLQKKREGKDLYYVCTYCKAELEPSDCPDLFY